MSDIKEFTNPIPLQAPAITVRILFAKPVVPKIININYVLAERKHLQTLILFTQ